MLKLLRQNAIKQKEWTSLKYSLKNLHLFNQLPLSQEQLHLLQWENYNLVPHMYKVPSMVVKKVTLSFNLMMEIDQQRKLLQKWKPVLF